MTGNTISLLVVFWAGKVSQIWRLALRWGTEAIVRRKTRSCYLPRAHDAAAEEAAAIAYAPGNEAGHAEINARAPNYPPAQMLYAFAIENVLRV